MIELVQFDLNAAVPKCRDFSPNGTNRDQNVDKEDYIKRKYKEPDMQKMSQYLDRIQSLRSGKSDAQLRFNWVYSLGLLGVALDCYWSFRQHFQEVTKKT